MKSAKENIQKVYVVDDDEMFAFTLELWFKKQKEYGVTVFNSGEEMLERLKSDAPDFILLDYYLDAQNPNSKNGSEILARVKDWDDQIPVIMLSGQKNLETATDLFAQGAFDFVVKDDNFHEHLQRTLNGLKQVRVQ